MMHPVDAAILKGLWTVLWPVRLLLRLFADLALLALPVGLVVGLILFGGGSL